MIDYQRDGNTEHIASLLCTDALVTLFGIISNDCVNCPWRSIPTASGAVYYGSIHTQDFISAEGYLDGLVLLGLVEYEDIGKDDYDLVRATPAGVRLFQDLPWGVKAECVERWVNHPCVSLFISSPSHHEYNDATVILLTAAELGDGEDMLSVYGISHEN